MYLGSFGKLDIINVKKAINEFPPRSEKSTGSIKGSMGGTLVLIGFLAILDGKWLGIILFQSQLGGIVYRGSQKLFNHPRALEEIMEENLRGERNFYFSATGCMK